MSQRPQNFIRKREKNLLTLAHIHRANTIKHHMKAELASMEPDFPVNGWIRLITKTFLA